MNKFCVPFKRNKEYNSEVKEFTIVYKDNMDQLIDFLSFVNQEQRVNIIIHEITKEIADEFILIKAKHPEFNFALGTYRYDFLGSDIWKDLRNSEVPFYIDSLCDTPGMFQFALEMGVCDILVGGDLGFSIKEAAAAAKSRNVAIRVICNLSQSIITTLTNQMTSFFVRPEDIDKYSEYVDTFEIFDPKEDNYNIDVIYEVYTKDKKWNGLLSEIILDFYLPVNNTYLMPDFANRRLNCHKKCAFCKCDLCHTMGTLCNTMEEKGLLIKTDS